MPPQKRPTRPVTQTPDPAAAFDAPRWYGPDGTLTSGRLDPGEIAGDAADKPLMPGGELSEAGRTDAALDSQPVEGVG